MIFFLSFSLPQPVGKKRGDIYSVRTLLCEKWRYRPGQAPLRIRRTNLLSVTLQQGLTDDSTSPSVRHKFERAENSLRVPSLALLVSWLMLQFCHLVAWFSADMWGESEGGNHGSCLSLYILLYIFIFVSWQIIFNKTDIFHVKNKCKCIHIHLHLQPVSVGI